MSALCGAPRYRSAEDLWLLTSLFSPVGFESRLRNYRRVRSVLDASGLRRVTIECVFGNAPFQLPHGPSAIQVRARDVLWQKEQEAFPGWAGTGNSRHREARR